MEKGEGFRWESEGLGGGELPIADDVYLPRTQMGPRLFWPCFRGIDLQKSRFFRML